jgi:hypothetical protein
MGLELAAVPHRTGGVQAALQYLAAGDRASSPKRERAGAKIGSTTS